MVERVEKVLLYSGGMDSIIADWLYEPDLCLYVNTRAIYTEKELASMVKPARGRLTTDSSIDLSAWERPDLIVPMRNAFLILAAANYGDHILLGATSGDRSCDKDAVFADHMQCLLNHVWQEQHWNKARDMKVEFPLIDSAKGTLVARYLERGGDPQRLVDCISCYGAEPGQCGACKPCARKWAALKWAGIECDDVFQSPPRNYFSKELVSQIMKHEWRGPLEDQQTWEALNAD